ncbi:hypothetical protein TUM17567_00110 [Citrobacter amalonaticus]|nr:hypothetical protein TUM17567_00110 [Citrobacter amalonaticus]
MVSERYDLPLPGMQNARSVGNGIDYIDDMSVWLHNGIAILIKVSEDYIIL